MTRTLVVLLSITIVLTGGILWLILWSQDSPRAEPNAQELETGIISQESQKPSGTASNPELTRTEPEPSKAETDLPHGQSPAEDVPIKASQRPTARIAHPLNLPDVSADPVINPEGITLTPEEARELSMLVAEHESETQQLTKLYTERVNQYARSKVETNPNPPDVYAHPPATLEDLYSTTPKRIDYSAVGLDYSRKRGDGLHNFALPDSDGNMRTYAVVLRHGEDAESDELWRTIEGRKRELELRIIEEFRRLADQKRGR